MTCITHVTCCESQEGSCGQGCATTVLEEDSHSKATPQVYVCSVDAVEAAHQKQIMDIAMHAVRQVRWHPMYCVATHEMRVSVGCIGMHATSYFALRAGGFACKVRRCGCPRMTHRTRVYYYPSALPMANDDNDSDKIQPLNIPKAREAEQLPHAPSMRCC